MKNKILILVLSSLFAVSVNSCKTTCCHNNATVSFGSNTNLLNCLCTAKVYVDGNEIGEIPGSVSDVISCDNENNLNVEFSESDHYYEIIIFSGSDTLGKQTGYFDVSKSDCIKLFFDVNNL